jgi:hypothetical protein
VLKILILGETEGLNSSGLWVCEAGTLPPVLNIVFKAGHRWLMPVILPTWEAESRRIIVGDPARQK